MTYERTAVTTADGQVAHVRADMAGLLAAGHSNAEVARRLGCDRHEVGVVRRTLGLANVPQQPLSLEEKWATFTEPVDGGHLRWSGTRQSTSGTPTMQYREQIYTAARLAFRIQYGREPVGYAFAECGLDQCVAPAHVDDDAGRQRTREQLRYLIGRGERPARCVHSHDQATEGAINPHGIAYCRACLRERRHTTSTAPKGPAMQKIPTVFQRDPDDRAHVLPAVTGGCEWVLTGEGVARRKYDGTCVMYDGTEWWARREVKPGMTPPPGYLPISTDPVTARTVGWEPIRQSAFTKYHAEAVAADIALGLDPDAFPTGTYELVGPKINGNPEGKTEHLLFLHCAVQSIPLPPVLTFEALRSVMAESLAPKGFEGIVWHHPDGRMAKLKVRDFPAPFAPNYPPVKGSSL